MNKIDLTYPLNKEMLDRLLETVAMDKNFEKFRHFGTHVDVMYKDFPLDNCERNGKILM
jgi:hypothetical protein